MTFDEIKGKNMLNKNLIFDEIYDFFGKKLLTLGFKVNKNKTKYTYSSDFITMMFELKFSKGKIVHLTFCLNQHDLELIFLDIENKQRLLADLPELVIKQNLRPIMSITDWQDVLISHHLDDQKYSDWMVFLNNIDEVKKLQPSYDRILEIVQNSFINKMKSMHDLYDFLYHKSHKNATDYIYQLIIAKVLNRDYFKVYAEIQQELNFLHMMAFYQSEVDFAFHYLKDYPIQEI